MKTLFKKQRSAKEILPEKSGFRHAKSALALAIFSSVSLFAQEQTIVDTTKTTNLDEVLVAAVRVTAQTPVTFSNVSKKELQSRNLGQDIPSLLNYLPSVVTTTDAGNGIGYSSIRVRGADATRVNVTVNGIPYNDSESQGTFWVNMPDFASSLENIQLQRGVGTSTNGAAAFGASLNLLTDAYANKANAEISNSFGSFNSRKHTVKFSTGLMNDHFELAGRLSNIKSDGYIDRAFSDMKSYFLQGTYVNKNTLIKALVFGGKEQTYQAWNGIDKEMLDKDRRFNPSGMFTDADGNTRFYDNETDNYTQDHYQLHWSEKWSENWNTNLAFHYTKGEGFYENYKENDTASDYLGINPTELDEDGNLTLTDLIRQKWLVNDFYGATFSSTYKKDKWNVIVGGGWNKYEGDHFGKVIWARNAGDSELGDKYYDDASTKTDLNVFAKANYQILDKLSLFGDLQYRTVNYKANGEDTGLVDDTFEFFNPKAGLTFTVNDKNNIYFSYAVANREPRRDDYENGSFKSERLNDFELGWRYASPKVKLNVNGFYMRYKDQLVLTGALNDVGAPVYTNSGDSYRLGLEIDATVSVNDKVLFRPNLALSTNKNIDFYSEVDGELKNLGDTNIAFSPNFIASNAFTYLPFQNFQVSLLTKLVGEQYMSNVDDKAAKLESYFVNDINLVYEIKTKSIFKSIILTGLVNNVFDYEYVSNGADYGGGYLVYFPQAGINFLAGLTLKF
ncbi:TonB-dependent receptor [uncultured Flavobacterium sp.]|uniref:TonB-dependent receptor n=1 Tax=uncultured Flavobacterium sp. TaxID=165435 RepID=UPI0025F47667|nr:TonB-dependent receptor [uncultured Flavobacterium sp.]